MKVGLKKNVEVARNVDEIAGIIWRFYKYVAQEIREKDGNDVKVWVFRCRKNGHVFEFDEEEMKSVLQHDRPERTGCPVCKKERNVRAQRKWRRRQAAGSDKVRWLCLVWCRTTPYYKLAYVADVERSVQVGQAWCPHGLDVVKSVRAGAAAKGRVGDCIAECRIRGDWYRLTEAEKEMIEDVMDNEEVK